MMGRSHLAHGMTAASAFVYVMPFLAPRDVVLVWCCVAAGSLAPDLDHVKSKASLSFHDGKKLSWLVTRFGGHRTWTHAPHIGPPIFGFVFTLALVFLDGPLGRMSWAYGLGLMVGCYTHLYGDARTLSGIPFPWGRQGRLRLGKTIETGSDVEERRYVLFYRPLALLSIAATVYSLVT